jgi:excisionase family DNA binding protein
MSKKIPPSQPLDSAQRYSVDEAIAYLRTSRATVYNLINAGSLRVIREGKRVFVPGTEIARRSTLTNIAAV